MKKILIRNNSMRFLIHKNKFIAFDKEDKMVFLADSDFTFLILNKSLIKFFL